MQALLDDNDICMHVDGAGVIGMKHLPYYPQQLTNEPQGFTCLGLKNTFAKIHGFGRRVYQSYPDIEKQGANLIVEIIFRSVATFMKEKKRKTLRNLSVFIDNTPVNKCYTVIAAMCSLVLLGNSLSILLLTSSSASASSSSSSSSLFDFNVTFLIFICRNMSKSKT
jgi:hypothetical protein